MQELLHKEAPLTINVTKKFLFISYKKSFYFEVKQANLNELVEFDYFFKGSSISIINYLSELLHKINKKFNKKDFYKLTPEQFDKVLDFFLKNYCKGFYSIEEGKSTKEDKAEQVNTKPFSAVLAFIIKNSNETRKSLGLLTWEEIEYLSEGIIYELNEETKEGKLLNQKNKTQKDLESGKFERDIKAVKKQRKNILGLLNTNKL